jgi:hypothetical protein
MMMLLGAIQALMVMMIMKLGMGIMKRHHS